MQINQLTDKTLIELSQLGDQTALGNLFLKYIPLLKKISCRILKDPILAEDITQNTFEKVIKEIKENSFRGENESSFAAWIYTINYNECMNHFRKVKVQPVIVSDNRINDGSEYSVYDSIKFASINGFFKKETRSYLQGTLSLLPLPYKEILELKFLNDLSYEEIVQYYGNKASIITYKNRVYLALLCLRKKMGVKIKKRKAILQ